MKKKTKKKFWLVVRLALVGLFFGTLVVMDMVSPHKQVAKIQTTAGQVAGQVKDRTKSTWFEALREAKDMRGDLEEEARDFQEDLGEDAAAFGKNARARVRDIQREVGDLDLEIPALPRLATSLPPLPPLPRMIPRDMPKIEDFTPEHFPFEESLFKEAPAKEGLAKEGLGQKELPLKEKPTPKPMPISSSTPVVAPKPEAALSGEISGDDFGFSEMSQEEMRGKIAIVIDDVGLHASLSARAIALPEEVTLSFLPYAPKLAAQVAHAKNAGHGVMLHLPMEPKSGLSAGPKALLMGLDANEFQARLSAALNSFQGYDGVNNHMGSKLTTAPREMGVVMKALKERGVFFLDSRTTPASLAAKIARESGLKTAARDVFLDDDPAMEAVMVQLRQLEITAQRTGQAIAIGHPHATTLTALEAWIPKARADGFSLVPVRNLVE